MKQVFQSIFRVAGFRKEGIVVTAGFSKLMKYLKKWPHVAIYVTSIFIARLLFGVRHIALIYLCSITFRYSI